MAKRSMQKVRIEEWDNSANSITTLKLTFNVFT